MVHTSAYGESDRIVRLLTRSGRIDAFAPGARRSQRRFGGALEPLQSIQADLHRRTRADGLVTLKSATVLRPRLGLRADLARIALGSYGSELGLRTAPEGEASPNHDQVVELLDFLDRAPASAVVRRAFELRLVPGLGYGPEVSACVVCGARSVPAFLDLRHGGRLCSAHGVAAEVGRRRVGPRTLDWVRSVMEADQLRPDVSLGPEGATRAAGAVGPVLDAFFQELVDRPIKSLSFLMELGIG
ncbi:MAG: DNA repair protein RecO [Myxococcota bacterium]